MFHLVGLENCQTPSTSSVWPRSIGLLLGPFTALYRSFLKRCNMTNKAVGTIWRALSKPPNRRLGPDPRPLISRDSFILGHELAYRLGVAQPTLKDAHTYFWFTIILLYMFVYLIFMTSPIWLAVGLQSLLGGLFIIFLNVYPFDYTAVAVNGKIERSLTGLTTSVEWLLLLQLTVLSRSVIVV